MEAIGKPYLCVIRAALNGLPALSIPAHGRGCRPHADRDVGAWSPLAGPALPPALSPRQLPCGPSCPGDIFMSSLVQALPLPLSPVHPSPRLGWPGCHKKPHRALAALGVALSPPPPDSWDRRPHYTAEAARPGMSEPLTPGSQPEVAEWGLDPGVLLTSLPPALGAPVWESQHPQLHKHPIILHQSVYFSTPQGT